MRRWLPFALLFALLLGFRVLGSLWPEALPNFQPLAALFFCGALLAGGWRGFGLAAAAWLLTYPLPALLQGQTHFLSPAVFATTLLAFVAVFLLGRRLRGRGAPGLLLGSLAGALLFHVITCTAAWLGSGLYPMNAGGLWQSLWSGPPGSPLPSWIFLRNLAAANLLFTAMFLASHAALPRPLLLASPRPAR